jgi:hypothetical protein
VGWTVSVAILRFVARFTYLVFEVLRTLVARGLPRRFGMPACRYVTAIQMRILSWFALAIVARMNAAGHDWRTS